MKRTFGLAGRKRSVMRARWACSCGLIVVTLHAATLLCAQAAALPSQSQRGAPEASCAAADQALADGRYDSAVTEYSICSKAFPGNFAVYSNMGVAFSRLGRMQDSIASYRKALELDPANEKVEFNLAVALVKAGDYVTAVDHLKHLEQVGSDLRYDELLAFCYYHLESYPLAARSAEKVLQVHPDDAANALILGSTYTRMGLYEKAVPLITLALKAAGSAEGHLIMAQTLLGLHRYHEAEDELKQVASVQPDFPGLHTAMGSLYVGLDQSASAQKEFSAALQQDPRDFEANYLMGRLKRLDGDKASANHYLDIADQLRPNAPEIKFERAAMAITDHRYADAVPLLEAVIKAEPDHAQAYLMLAQSYQKTGRREDAKREGQLYGEKRRQAYEKAASQQ